MRRSIIFVLAFMGIIFIYGCTNNKQPESPKSLAKDFVYAYLKNGNGIEKKLITKNTDSPKQIAKNFVAAYLANDEVHMQALTFKRTIDYLKSIDTKIRYAFKHISKYTEQKHGNIASVAAYTYLLNKPNVKPTPFLLEFRFTKEKNGWLLIGVAG